jgi:hypothetical protein
MKLDARVILEHFEVLAVVELILLHPSILGGQRRMSWTRRKLAADPQPAFEGMRHLVIPAASSLDYCVLGATGLHVGG